jgi:hypothetical protein
MTRKNFSAPVESDIAGIRLSGIDGAQIQNSTHQMSRFSSGFPVLRSQYKQNWFF